MQLSSKKINVYHRKYAQKHRKHLHYMNTKRNALEFAQIAKAKDLVKVYSKYRANVCGDTLAQKYLRAMNK